MKRAKQFYVGYNQGDSRCSRIIAGSIIDWLELHCGVLEKTLDGILPA